MLSRGEGRHVKPAGIVFSRGEGRHVKPVGIGV